MSPNEEIAEALNKTTSKLGTFVQEWNTVELMLRMALMQLAGGGSVTRILVAHMISEEMCGAIISLTSTENTAYILAEECQYAVAFFKRLRTYRNFYIHEPVRGFLVNMDDPQELRLGTQGIETRKNGESRFGGVTKAQIEQGIEWCGSLGAHLNWIIQESLRIQCRGLRAESRFEQGSVVPNIRPHIMDIPPEFRHPSKST